MEGKLSFKIVNHTQFILEESFSFSCFIKRTLIKRTLFYLNSWQYVKFTGSELGTFCQLSISVILILLSEILALSTSKYFKK